MGMAVFETIDLEGQVAYQLLELCVLPPELLDLLSGGIQHDTT